MKLENRTFFFTILLSALVSLPVLSAQGATSEEPQQFVVCKNRDIVRTIHINTEKSGGCTTKYTKAGNERVVGSGRFEKSCQSVLDNIRSNLEAASWKCRSASSAKILRSGDEGQPETRNE